RWDQAGSNNYHRFGTHRRYCAFDGPFQRFFYLDADTLLMGPVQPFFAQLESSDCVVYNYQYKNPEHVYNLSASKLTKIFPPERISSEIFCSGGYGSKQGLFDAQIREWLLSQLKLGEAEILYPMAPDQTIINYMMMRSGCSINNLALSLPKDKITGCCVTSSHFENKDNILYDKGNRLTYIHYIGLSSTIFKKLCAGENIDFPYRDIFLYYRYYHQPEKLPKLTGKPVYYQQKTNLKQRIFQKLGFKK
ncbi:MAG: Npun_R2821/Npun_R2822 family protein, partial [Crocosphaera sp.]